MSRSTAVLVALVAVLGFALAFFLVRPAPQAITEADVRGLVSEAIAGQPRPVTSETVETLIGAALADQAMQRQQSQGTLDPEMLHPLIEDYLLSNPRILQRVAAALEDEIRLAEAEKARTAIATMQDAIYDASNNVVLGNPDGDVTLVELFDYNCGYCRQALPDLATLLAEDPDLRVILKELPILSQESIDAARVAMALHVEGGDYWALHQALFTSRGRVDEATALNAVSAQGLDPDEMKAKATSPEVAAIIDENYAIARALGITGTPTFIIGDEVVAGAVGLDQLRLRIANMRACGETSCDAAAAGDSNAPANGSDG